MAETNEDSTLNPELNPDPNPNKSERRQLKKSKTITEHAGHTPHFPGPLFPAVRRISTLPNSHAPPRPSDLRVSVPGGEDPSWHHPNNANERDWIYPPFLGAYPARGRAVPVKAKPRKPETSDSSRRDSSVDVKLPDKTNRITAPVGNTDKNDNNNRDSDSKKPLVEPRRQVSVASMSSVSPFGVGRSREFKLLMSLYLVSFLFRSICLAVVSVW